MAASRAWAHGSIDCIYIKPPTTLVDPSPARSAQPASCLRHVRKRVQRLRRCVQRIQSPTPCAPAALQVNCALPHTSHWHSSPPQTFPMREHPPQNCTPLLPRPTPEPGLPVHLLRLARHRHRPHRPRQVIESACGAHAALAEPRCAGACCWAGVCRHARLRSRRAEGACMAHTAAGRLCVDRWLRLETGQPPRQRALACVRASMFVTRAFKRAPT